MNKLHLIASGILMFTALQTNAQNNGVSPKILTDETAALVMEPGKDPSVLAFEGIDGVWKNRAEGKYFSWLQKTENPASLLTLYKVTGQPKYFKAATALLNQLKSSTAQNIAGTAAFYAEYADLVKDQNAFDPLADQLISQQKQNSSVQNKARLGIALVDVLDYFPAEHSKRSTLLTSLNQLTGSMSKLKGEEPAVSAMFVYVLAKAARKGYVSPKEMELAKHIFKGLQRHTFSKDAEATGAYLLACNEMEIAAMAKTGTGKTVMLDSYFNDESRKDQSGNKVSWHYKWDERSNGGFSFWGGQFNHAGFRTSTLYTAPTAESLNGSSVYIIVDPDTEKESSDPKFIQADHIQVITDWVKAGGVLVLMGNDVGNAELEHTNKLAKVFGIQFNLDSKGTVTDDQFDMGKIRIPAGDPVFKTARQLFIKEFSSLAITSPAKPVLKDKDGNIVVALSKLGGGAVIVVGDPWLYNEYVDGRRLPAAYDNFKAGADLVNWISGLIPARKK